MKKIIYLLAIVLFYLPQARSQGITNDGCYVKISQATYLKVTGNTGNFVNDKTGALNGKIQNDGRISVQGKWRNSATAGNVFINRNGIGEVVLNGSAAQSVGGSASTYFENLSIDNPTGVTLGIDQSVDNNLKLKNGILTTAANKIIVLDTNSNAIKLYSVNNYINGNLRRYVKGSKQYDLPLGTAAHYELANVNVSTLGSLAYLDASFVNASPGAVPGGLNINGTPITDFLDYGYWKIVPNNDLNAVYDITCTSRGHSNGATVASAHALFYRPNAGTWQNFGTHNNSTQSGTGVNPVTAKRTNAGNFYEYVIGKSSDETLDIDLLSFQAMCSKDHAVDIYWATSSETNNDYFTVYKSTDGMTWSEISNVSGAGNSNQIINYSVTDNDYHGNIAYYKLMQTDYDGSTTLFNISSVNCFEALLPHMSIYPNPVMDFLNISIRSDLTDNLCDVKILNMEGQLCYYGTITGSASIDVSKLKSALYYIIITDRVSGEQHKEKIEVN